MTTLIPDSWELPSHVAAGQSRGRQDADDWLSRNTPESFEHDPEAERAAAQRWMDEHAHEYTEWHPSGGDYTYGDFGDAAGQSFHGQDESRSHVLPGSAYQEEDDDLSWEDHYAPGSRHDSDDYEVDDEENEGLSPTEQSFEDHGFRWRVRNVERTPTNPSGSQAEYYREQHDPEGNHIATHVIRQDDSAFGSPRWSLTTALSDSRGTANTTSHLWAHDALDRYRQNAADALLPGRGYEPDRGRTGWARSWHRSEPAPDGNSYEHYISFPESGEGFSGSSRHPSLSQPNYGNRSERVTHSFDLSDVVLEHDRISQGSHPGGRRDQRMTREQLVTHPSASVLGRPESQSTPQGDGLISRMTWRIPHPYAPRGVNAEAQYNWDSGNYEFRYTHDGTRLAPTHNYVPEGAPVTIPGRQR